MPSKSTLYVVNDSLFLLPHLEDAQRAAERLAASWKEFTRPEPGKSGYHYNVNRLGGLGLAFATANPDVPLTRRSHQVTDQVIGATCDIEDEVAVYHVMTIHPSSGLRMTEPLIETSVTLQGSLPDRYVTKSLREFINTEIPEDSPERPTLYAVRIEPGDVETYHGDHLEVTRDMLWGLAENDHIISQIDRAIEDYAQRQHAEKDLAM